MEEDLPVSRSHFSLLWVPVLALATIILHDVVFINEAIYLVSTLIHEVGHTVAAWLCGVPAIPTHLFFMVVFEDQQSFFWGLLVAAGAAASSYHGISRGILWLFATSVVVMATALVFSSLTAFVSDRFSPQVILYGGLGGELILSTVGILAGFSDLPRTSRWMKFQTAATIIGTVVFSKAALMWIQAQSDHTLIPFGAMLDLSLAEGESSGDLDTLIREFGWTKQVILQTYLITTIACLLAVVTAYGFALRRAWQERA